MSTYPIAAFDVVPVDIDERFHPGEKPEDAVARLAEAKAAMAAARHPNAVVLGADSIEDLVHWYKVRELIDACNLTTMQRAGYPPPDFDRFEPLWGPERVAKLKRNVVETPRIDISSTEVRRRLAAGGDVTGMLHPDVIAYIRRHGLYRQTGE